MWYCGIVDVVIQNIDIVDSYDVDYIIIFVGDYIYKMDYEIMLCQYVEFKVDVIIGCLIVFCEEVIVFGVMGIDVNGQIMDFFEKLVELFIIFEDLIKLLVLMGIYVFNWKFLCELLLKDVEDFNFSYDFGNDLIFEIVKNGKVMVYCFDESCVWFKGVLVYWKDVGIVDVFWSVNIDFIDFIFELNLWDKDWLIWIYVEGVLLVKFIYDEKDCCGMVILLMVLGGCVILGIEVCNFLLFMNVYINFYVVLENVVVLLDVVVN